MFGRDARPVIADVDLRLRFAFRGYRRPQRDVDAFAGSPVFERVFHQVLEHADQLIVVAGDRQLGRCLDVDGDATVARQGFQAVRDLADDRHQVDQRIGPAVRIQLDPRQRQQVVDQPRHAPRLLLHDGEEALPRLGVVARRALQGLDEAGKRRQRRAQLVAGIGDEVGAHLFGAAQRGEVMKHHQHQIGLVRIRLAPDRHHDRLEPAVARHALGIFDTLLFAAGIGAADRLVQLGHPQRQRDQLAAPQRRRQGTRALIKREYAPVAVERDRRIRQPGDDGLERVAGAFGDGSRPRQAAGLLAGAHGEESGRRDQGETRDRVADGKGVEQRQSGEYDRRGYGDEPHAAPSALSRRYEIVVQAHRIRPRAAARPTFGSSRVRLFPRQPGHGADRRCNRVAEAPGGTTDQSFTRSEDHQREDERNDVIKATK